MIIYLDMDGVLFDWLTPAAKACGVDLDSEDVKWTLERDRLEGIVGKGKVWKTIDALGHDFWANLEPYPWCKDLWDHASHLSGGEVYICTAPSNKPESIYGKMISIQKHLKTRQFVITPHKHLLAEPYTLLVDDTPKKVRKFADAGGITYLWPHAFTLSVEGAYEKAKADITELVRFHKSLQKG